MRSIHFAITAAALILGFLIAHQINVADKLAEINKGDDVKALAVETGELLKNIDNLESQKQKLDQQKVKLSSPEQESQTAINEAIENLKIVTGSGAVAGQGIEVTFDKPLTIADIIDLVNALRNLGAEAIGVGDKRVTASTGFNQSDGAAPVKVKAIGQKDLLGDGAARRFGILEQIGQGSVTKHDVITIEP